MVKIDVLDDVSLDLAITYRKMDGEVNFNGEKNLMARAEVKH